MSHFDILEHPNGKVVVIKRGFTWIGFFLTGPWLIINGLWLQAFNVIVLNAFMFFSLSYLNTLAPHGAHDDSITGIRFLFYFSLAIYVGWAGNEWRFNKMIAKGFKPTTGVEIS